MGSESVDLPDVLSCQEIMFDKDNNESLAWKFCFATNIPRSQVIFFVHVLSAFSVITICLVKLIFLKYHVKTCHFGHHFWLDQLDIYYLAQSYEQNHFYYRKSFHVSCWTIWIWKNPTDFFYAHIQDLLSTLSKNLLLLSRVPTNFQRSGKTDEH